MINGTNLTSSAVGLLGSEVFGTLEGIIIGLIVSVVLAIVCGKIGAKSKNTVAKIISYILAVIGIIGAINFGFSLWRILELMNNIPT